MTEIEFYEAKIKPLGIDFYEFLERISIMTIDGNIALDIAMNHSLEYFRNEKLNNYKPKKINLKNIFSP